MNTKGEFFDAMTDWTQRLTIGLPRAQFLEVYHSPIPRACFLACEGLLANEACDVQAFKYACRESMKAWQVTTREVGAQWKGVNAKQA